MKKLFAGIILIALIGVGFLVFYKLGGFTEIVVSQSDMGQLELSGIYFQGTPTQTELRDAFSRIEAIQRNQPEAFLYTLYYSEPAGKLDTMEVFVGVEKRFVSQDTLQTLNLDASDVIVATISAHKFVMPGPNKVKSEIQEYADLVNLPRPVVYLDKIISSSEVQVIGLQNTGRLN